MLIHVDDLAEASVGERFTWALHQVAAVDREHDIEMTASRGRRRYGRARRYYVAAPSGRTWTDARGNVLPYRERIFTLSAYTDDEAVAKANPRLQKWLGKGLVWDATQYTWVRPTQEAG